MFAPVGPRGGSSTRPPPPPPLAQAVPEPDLSHLTEEERKIIMAVLARQREEEAKEEAMLKEEKPIQARTVNLVGQKKPPQQNDVRGIQQQLSSYRESVIRQATAAAGHRDDAPTCGICHKTKFADGCGSLCSYCHTKFCARCGGRVSLRSNTEDKVSTGSERGRSRSRRRRDARQRRTQTSFRRLHHGRRLGLHLPIAIPPDRWYAGVGSLVCAQCRTQHDRRRNRTSWMCLECRVPLCLLTWRNCYSQWHCGDD